MPELLGAVSAGQDALVALVTFVAAALAAVTGYGAGVILPLVLVPVIGALISVLLAAGLDGTAVIATDAGVSLVLSAVKTIVFQASGMLTPATWLMALMIGIVAFPAAFLARRIIPRLPPDCTCGSSVPWS